MTQFHLRLFGTPQIAIDGHVVAINLRKGMALLAYVAVTRQPHSRDAFATLLWPEKDQAGARANLRRTLYDLSHILGPQLLDVAAETVALHAGAALWLDIAQFQHVLAACLPEKQAASLSTDDTCLARLVDAADLYRGDFMAGFTLPDCPEFDDWQFFQREHWRRAFATLVKQLDMAYAARRQWELALQFARRWLALDPLEEAAHRRLMELYAHAGETGAALRQYDECARILDAELGVTPAAATVALREAIRTRHFPPSDHAAPQPDARVSRQAMPAALAPRAMLPPQTTGFVGRQAETAELLRHLRDPHCRLLTLVGPGGIGKTRLAIATLQALRDEQAMRAVSGEPAPLHDFEDGSYFVSLQPVSAPSGIVPAIAGALGLQFYSGTPAQQQLLQFLHDKEMVLALDNFEHLLEGAQLVVEMLAGAPRVKILITSREALNLQEEWFHPVAGMRLPPLVQLPPGDDGRVSGTLPDAGDASAATAAASYDAVQLFVQTARRAQPAFDPAPHMPEIVRICRLVDGMPLGIELAASWLKVLTCAQIAGEIAANLDILVTRHQNVPARHRSMRVVLEQSWALLDAAAQGVLQRLAIFRGGFLQDAAAVAGADLLTLAELVDKAWIYRTPSGRYQLHELLRQYAAGQLAKAAAAAAEMHDRHADFYLHQVALLAPALTGPEQRTALEHIDAEFDNVQAAWMHAVDVGAFALIERALPALYHFIHIRSRHVEGVELFSRAAQRLEGMLEEAGQREDAPAMAALWHSLLARLAHFYLHQGDVAATRRCLAVVLDKSDAAQELALAYNVLGQLERVQGSRSAADAALHHSLKLARAVGDMNQTIETLKMLSDTASSWADFVEGKQFAEAALALCRRLQRPDLTSQVLAALAWPVNCLGEYAESARYYQESLEIAESIGSPFGVALATNFLGWVAFCAGGDRLPEALAYYTQALAIWRRIGHRTNLAMCLGDYALAANEAGDYVAAQRYAQEGLELTIALEHPDLMSYNLYHLGAAMCGLRDYAAAQRYLVQALQIARRAAIPDNLLAVLYFVAQLRRAESAGSSLSAAAALNKQREALELLALLIEHRATWQLFRDRARRTQAELAAKMPAEVAAAAIQRGRAQVLTEVVAAIIAAAGEASPAHAPASDPL